MNRKRANPAILKKNLSHVCTHCGKRAINPAHLAYRTTRSMPPGAMPAQRIIDNVTGMFVINKTLSERNWTALEAQLSKEQRNCVFQPS